MSVIRARHFESFWRPIMTQRYDFALISSWIPERSKVLDLGCGDGELLAGLGATRAVTGYGIEIDPANVLACVKNGVNVLQDDLESGLSTFAARVGRAFGSQTTTGG